MGKLMGIIMKLAEKQGKSMFLSLLEKKKDVIIANLNKKIDIPFASEKDEKEFLEGVWEMIEDAVKEAVK